METVDNARWTALIVVANNGHEEVVRWFEEKKRRGRGNAEATEEGLAGSIEAGWEELERSSGVAHCPPDADSNDIVVL